MPVAPWFSDLLERELRPWLNLSAEQVASLYLHYQVLECWNEKVSLTSLKPGEELVIRHYCESLFLGAHLAAGENAAIVDVGSGAGFPGVPLAVLRPGWRVTLVESVQRKAVFLREATRHVKNVSVLAQRAEEVDPRFDWLVSRAVHPKDVVSQVPRLAPRIGLLVGEASVPLLRTFPGIAWGDPIRLPWGDRRYCILGKFHVEQ